MSLNFPDAPSINDEYSAEGRTWTWDGTVWLANETSVSIVSAESPIVYNTDTSVISIDLTSYDNSFEVDTKLANYDTSTEVDTKLADYDTSAQVNAKIAGISIPEDIHPFAMLG